MVQELLETSQIVVKIYKIVFGMVKLIFDLKWSELILFVNLFLCLKLMNYDKNNICIDLYEINFIS